MTATPPPARHATAPGSTYRLQIHDGFPLAAAGALAGYLRDLGVTTVYTSPLLAARPGSRHGYDGVDPGHVAEGVGGAAGFAAFVQTLKAHGLTLLVDIVPNHLAAVPDNPWWADVLARGPASPYAGHFDIDFDHPPRPALAGRVLVPTLGGPYGEVLAAGDIRLVADAGGVRLRVYDRVLPLAAGTAPAVADVAAVNADPARLDAVLAAQHYRLCHWRTAADEVNYRRFFDVNDLAAVRADRPDVFAATHAVVTGWLVAGDVMGVRIDHPDGLADPAGYLDRLQAAAGAGRSPVYVAVEKILAWGEDLPPGWACAGATGYEFITAVNSLLVDPAAEPAMTAAYERFAGPAGAFADVVAECKLHMLDVSFGADADACAGRLDRAAQLGRVSRDFTRPELHAAVRRVAAAFPVYRTYVTDAATDADRAVAGAACAEAVRRDPFLAPAVRFLHDTLTLTGPPSADVPDAAMAGCRELQRDFARRFQQLTAPVTAKGIEDTAFYRYGRLIALNEVGGDPGMFGLEPDAVHAFLAGRPRGALNPLSTHDTKRGEDARARIAVLAEVPAEWSAAVGRWAALNARHKRPGAGGHPAPTPAEEYFFYQTLVGVWPGGDLAGLADRAAEYAVKALHEAKVTSSWRDPDAGHDAAVAGFLRAILDSAESAAFLADFAGFHAAVGRAGAVNSLAQTVLRCTAPGVPDTYQGSEFWDFSLVDPDNRRPVDYPARARALAALDAAGSPPADLESPAAKLFAVSRGLRFRRGHADLFAAGDYVPVPARGPLANHLFAFLRTHGGRAALAVVPRLPVALGRAAAADRAATTLDLPAEWAGRVFTDVFTGRPLSGAALLTPGAWPVGLGAV